MLHPAWIPAFACLREAEASLRRRQAGIAGKKFEGSQGNCPNFCLSYASRSKPVRFLRVLIRLAVPLGSQMTQIPAGAGAGNEAVE